MRCLAAGKTIKGKVRDINEDTIYINTEYGVFAVADGMGGHAAGEVASTIAINALANRVRFANKLSPREFLKSVFDEANWGIIEAARYSPEKRGMGTTLSILYIKGEKYYIGHVGDSRVYLVRNDELYQLTEDDTQVNILVKRGMLTRKEAVDSPQAGVLTKAVGTSAHLMPTFYEGDIQSRDIFLLTSDGFHDLVDKEVILKDEIINILRFNSTDKAAEQLVDIANNRSGHDNISVIVVKPLKVKRIKYTLHKISTALKFAMGFLFAVIIGMAIYRFDIISKFKGLISHGASNLPCLCIDEHVFKMFKVWINGSIIDTTPYCRKLPPGNCTLSYVPVSIFDLCKSSQEDLRELRKDTTIKLSNRDSIFIRLDYSDYPWRFVYMEFDPPIDTFSITLSCSSCRNIENHYKLQVKKEYTIEIKNTKQLLYEIACDDPRIRKIKENSYKLQPDTLRFVDTVKFQVKKKPQKRKYAKDTIEVILRSVFDYRKGSRYRKGIWVYRIGGQERDRDSFEIAHDSLPRYTFHILRPPPNVRGELEIIYEKPSGEKKDTFLVKVTHQTPRIDTILK